MLCRLEKKLALFWELAFFSYAGVYLLRRELLEECGDLRRGLVVGWLVIVAVWAVLRTARFVRDLRARGVSRAAESVRKVSTPLTVCAFAGALLSPTGPVRWLTFSVFVILLVASLACDLALAPARAPDSEYLPPSP